MSKPFNVFVSIIWTNSRSLLSSLLQISYCSSFRWRLLKSSLLITLTVSPQSVNSSANFLAVRECLGADTAELVRAVSASKVLQHCTAASCQPLSCINSFSLFPSLSVPIWGVFPFETLCSSVSSSSARLKLSHLTIIF